MIFSLYFILLLAHVWNITGYELFRDGDVFSWGRTLGGYCLHRHLCLSPGPASQQIQALSSWQYFPLDLMFTKSRIRRKSRDWDKYSITCDLIPPQDRIFVQSHPESLLSFLLTNLPVWAFSTVHTSTSTTITKLQSLLNTTDHPSVASHLDYPVIWHMPYHAFVHSYYYNMIT